MRCGSRDKVFLSVSNIDTNVEVLWRSGRFVIIMNY